MQKISSLLPPKQSSPSGTQSSIGTYRLSWEGQKSVPSRRALPVSLPRFQGGMTPVPNGFLDYVLPTLSDTELRVLLIVVRSTHGWRAEGSQNAERKARDWISHHQFQQRTGRAGAAVSKAIDGLVRRGLLVVQDETGQERVTTKERRIARGRLYYQLRPDWKTDWKAEWEKKCEPEWEKSGDKSLSASTSQQELSGSQANALSKPLQRDAIDLARETNANGTINQLVNHPTDLFPGNAHNNYRYHAIHPQWDSFSGLHQVKRTKEIRTKEISTKGEKLTEIKIDLSSLKSEVITVDLQGLVPELVSKS